MSTFFVTVFNMSVSASWIVLAVLLLRFLFRKAPKWIRVLLWGIVAVRLICPFSIESFMSLIPSAETIRPDVLADIPQIHTGFPTLNSVLNPIIQDFTVTIDTEQSINAFQWLVQVVSQLWIMGVIAAFAYMAISYWRLHRKLHTAVKLRDRLYQSENVVSPFVLGVIKPKIYLPYHIDEPELSYVIAHEQAHIRRKDHLWKPLGFLLLAIHWFNPLMWIGYVLLCRDIELACDEKVVKEMNGEQRADYSQALLTCSVNRRTIAACPLAFGEVGVKARVKSVLSYKKPAFWVIIAAVLASVVLAFCFLTNPATSLDEDMATFIENKILAHQLTVVESGEFRCTDFKVLGTQKENDTTTVYAWVLYLEYNKTGSGIKEVSGAHTPTAITVKETETDFELIEYWEPGDGTHYTPDIKGKFPWYLHAAAVDGQRYIREQRVNCERKAEAYFASIADIGGVGVPPAGIAIDDKALRVKYPMYYDLDTQNGLEVYIWQMAEGSYSCGLLPHKKGGYSQEELWELYKNPTSIDEMAAIVCTYLPEVTQDDVAVYAIRMPHSSYLYKIDAAYRESIEALFWAKASQMLLTMDAENFDIDNDGVDECCILQYGPTSGLFTFKFLVYDNGRLEYFNIFQSPWMDLHFEENAEGVMMLIGEESDGKTRFMGMEISEGTIVISSDEQDITSWGEQGTHSIFAPGVKENMYTAIENALHEQYQSEKPDGLLHVETYRVLMSESESATPLAGSNNHFEVRKVYLLVYHARYSPAGDQLTVVESGIVPAVLTFKVDENGEYSLEEYWTPQKGSAYESDIREKFPEQIAEFALNPEEYTNELQEENIARAKAYLEKMKEE